jgi:hypothetical protein
MKNLELWNKVEKTNPKYTKKAKIGGNSITSIAPQYQIMNATEQFGVYGQTWGFKNIVFDYSITNTPITIDVQDYNTKQVDKIQTILGLVGFKATFFFPEGEFEITNSIKIFTDNKHSKIDDNYAKKLETDALTKALSKLGFNADIFMGKFDDVRYVNEMNIEFGNTPAPDAASQPAPDAASQPAPKETLTDERFENALKLIAEGKYTVEKLKAVYNLTPNQLKQL